jgi:hypothetical protein
VLRAPRPPPAVLGRW